MRNLPVRYVVSLLLLAAVPRTVCASWLSDISGVDINIPNNTITLGAPRPDRIPMMLQNLPKDLAIYLLNPLAGGALAYAIREAKASARKVCVAVPGKIRVILAPFFPPELFQGVCWAVVGTGQSLDTWAIRDRGMTAITLEGVIVFRDNDAGYNDSILWAHELTHVLQYRSLGVEGFAALYVVAFDALEQQARDFDQFVARTLSAQRVQGPPGQNVIPQYWIATNDWKTSKPIAVQQYVSYARQAVEPLKCTTVRNTMHQNPYPLAYVDVVNSCPIAIRVSSFHVRNVADGAVQSTTCASIFIDCTIGPGKVGSWAVAGIRRTDTGGNFNVTADIVW